MVAKRKPAGGSVRLQELNQAVGAKLSLRRPRYTGRYTEHYLQQAGQIAHLLTLEARRPRIGLLRIIERSAGLISRAAHRTDGDLGYHYALLKQLYEVHLHLVERLRERGKLNASEQLRIAAWLHRTERDLGRTGENPVISEPLPQVFLYAGALDLAAFEHYRKLVAADDDSAEATQQKELQAALAVAALAGDGDQIVELLGGHLAPVPQLEQMVIYLELGGCDELASSIAALGFSRLARERVPTRYHYEDPPRIVHRAARDLLASGEGNFALEVLFMRLSTQPSLARFHALRMWAAELEVWENWRQRAEHVVAVSLPREYLAYLLDSQRDDDAWVYYLHRARSLPWDLAEAVLWARAKTHPESVKEHYTQLIEAALATRQRSGYRLAARLCASLGEVSAWLGESAQFEQFTAKLLQAHRNRTGFNQEFTRKGFETLPADSAGAPTPNGSSTLRSARRIAAARGSTVAQVGLLESLALQCQVRTMMTRPGVATNRLLAGIITGKVAAEVHPQLIYDLGLKPMPQEGELEVLLDEQGKAVAIIKTTQVHTHLVRDLAHWQQHALGLSTEPKRDWVENLIDGWNSRRYWARLAQSERERHQAPPVVIFHYSQVVYRDFELVQLIIDQEEVAN